jgi:hypothetical protein
VWDHADVGIVGDWREAVPLLVSRLVLARGSEPLGGKPT